jgi:hypothetical protein
MATKDTPEQLAVRLVQIDRIIAEVLPAMWKDRKYLQERIDFWESRRVQAQEQLYNVRHGDVPCQPTDLGE